MGRAVYVDCFSGASGDMLLGALLDAGVRLDDLRGGLAKLPVSGWALHEERVRQHGLGGTRAGSGRRKRKACVEVRTGSAIRIEG